MRSIIHYSVILTMLSIIVSCNALYFYETDKISLTVEARPDSTQPVQGNFGLKQRLALVAPRISDTAEKGGEALSAVTSFRFHKAPGAAFDFGAVTIKTAFITGEAASGLGKDAVGAATAIVGGGNIAHSGGDIVIMRTMVRTLKKDANNKQAATLLSQLDVLYAVLIPEKYPVSLYEADGNSPNNLQISADIDSLTVFPDNFTGVLDYWSQLNTSVKTLKSVVEKPTAYRLHGKILNDPFSVSGIREVISKTENEMKRIRSELGSDLAYKQVKQYYIDNYL